MISKKNFIIALLLIISIFIFLKKSNVEYFQYLHPNNFVSLGRPDEAFFE